MPPIHHDKQRSARRSLDDIFNGPDEFGMLEVQLLRPLQLPQNSNAQKSSWPCAAPNLKRP